MLAEKYGWEAVDCYIQEPLACDSDDEKRIKRAVKESKALKLESKKPVAHSSQLAQSSPTILNRIPPCLGAWWFPPPSPRSNWGRMSLVFAVGDQAILPGTAELLSPCPQLGKHFDHGLQQEGFDELYDQSFDLWWSFLRMASYLICIVN